MQVLTYTYIHTHIYTLVTYIRGCIPISGHTVVWKVVQLVSKESREKYTMLRMVFIVLQFPF